MNTDFIFGLAFGLFCSNALIGYFVFKYGAIGSVGMGLTAALISVVLSLTMAAFN